MKLDLQILVRVILHFPLTQLLEFHPTLLLRILPIILIISSLPFLTQNKNHLFDAGDAVFVAFGDTAGKRATDFSDSHFSWSITLVKDTTIKDPNQKLPQPGDIIKIRTTKPFRTTDYVEFTTQRADFNKSKALLDMNNIAVVPNPYVGAATGSPLPLLLVAVRGLFISSIFQINVLSGFLQ